MVNPGGSVTHNFLLKICSTPPRAVALRLSIPHGSAEQCTPSVWPLRVHPGGIEPPTTRV